MVFWMCIRRFSLFFLIPLEKRGKITKLDYCDAYFDAFYDLISDITLHFKKDGQSKWVNTEFKQENKRNMKSK